ncbi:putative toxin-antitoxin system antitoxin component, TIGR02293 family [Catalinimonas alkaloidigena]|uniref:Putative toxin-antitoxin system antitoxin component, TIGR02293 family n=1 Tax=Catalinimonas alkaloidigena TaxID=1075417 RepID=A0A1G9SYF6_9BACT|nr:antitoxin Xre-like helix-turn-helix domain-containing protein [Catalinimonas alkaloidigena]SDM40483.1 putative toxin-antitoxin system antitoxin component, TIGR02293 family [Catalinimonas alkaloidigena]
MSALSILLEMPEQATPHLFIRKGVPASAIQRIMLSAGLSQKEIADLLYVSTRTLSRLDEHEPVNLQLSDRLYQLADIWGFLTEGWGEDYARRWIRKPLRALGGETPLQTMMTSAGIERLRQVAGRLQHGIPV